MSSAIQNRFTAGEVSLLFQSQVDNQYILTGLAKLSNFFITSQSILAKRNGLAFIGETKISSQKCRLFGLSLSYQNSFIIECGAGYFRFITLDSDNNYGYVISNSTNQIYEIGNDYLESELDTIDFFEAGDRLFLAHPKHPPRELIYQDTASWLFRDIYIAEFLQPTEKPDVAYKDIYLAINTSNVLSASDNYPFAVNQILKLVNNNATFAYVKVTSIINSKTCNVIILGNDGYRNLGAGFYNDPIYLWEETSFSASKGYPAAICMHDQRLYLSKDSIIYASQIGVFSNFAIFPSTASTEANGVNQNNSPMSLQLTQGLQNEILWLEPQSGSKRIYIGTVHGVFALDSFNNNTSISNTTAVINAVSKIGAAHVKPISVGTEMFYITRDGYRLSFLQYDNATDSVVDTDTNVSNPEITQPKVNFLRYSHSPYASIFAVKSDGEVAIYQYKPQEKILGWSRLNTQGTIESIYSIKGINKDDTFMLINRTINGETKRYIEKLSETTSLDIDIADSFFVDSGLIISSATQFNTLAGLDHLKGETVSILCDGWEHRNMTVAQDGKINLDYKVNKAIVGLPYGAELQTLGLNYIMPFDNTFNRRVKLKFVHLHIYKTGDFWLERMDRKKYQKPFISPSDLSTIELKSGIERFDLVVMMNKNRQPIQIKIGSSKPLPLNITALNFIVNFRSLS